MKTKKIKVQAGQSVPDIALQEYGSYESFSLVLLANPGVELTSELLHGQELLIIEQESVALINEIIQVEQVSLTLQSILSGLLSVTTGVERPPMTEEKSFEFRDIGSEPGQNYTLELKAAFNYLILALVLESDSGSITVTLTIDGNDVGGLTEVDATNPMSQHNSSGGRTVASGSRVELVTNALVGSPTALKGSLRYRRIL